jgi:hypothetical protein
MQLLKTLLKKIEINHYTTQKLDAISFYSKLSETYTNTEFHLIHSGDRHYICGDIYVTKETINDHKYQIEYLARFYECEKFDINDPFNDLNNATLILEKVV